MILIGWGGVVPEYLVSWNKVQVSKFNSRNL